MVRFVWLSADAYFICMTHALSTEREEVMGLLLGEELSPDVVWIYGVHMMRRSDKRPDRVEISPEQLSDTITQAQTLSYEMGKEVRVLGWYHSHPHITVWPSHVDVQTQFQYQSLDANFVGLIFSAFDDETACTSSIKVTCFQAARNTSNSGPTAYLRKEVPFKVVESDVSIGRPCINALLQLPQILIEEEEAAYREVQSSTVHPNRDILSGIYNGCLFSQNISLIMSDVCSPILQVITSHMNTQQQMIQQLRDQKARLQQERASSQAII